MYEAVIVVPTVLCEVNKCLYEAVIIVPMVLCEGNKCLYEAVITVPVVLCETKIRGLRGAERIKVNALAMNCFVRLV